MKIRSILTNRAVVQQRYAAMHIKTKITMQVKILKLL